VHRADTSAGAQPYPAPQSFLRSIGAVLLQQPTSQMPVSRDLLSGLYEHCALHAGDPHWGGMIAERKP